MHPVAMQTYTSKTKAGSTQLTSSSKKSKASPKGTPTEQLNQSSPSKRSSKANKPNISFASIAEATGRVPAYASMAQSNTPPIEGDLPDPFDIHPPPLYDDQVVANPNAKVAIYEEEVILDSGATDCMVPSFGYLDLI